MNTHATGRRYEEIAVEYLVANGWVILERNVRFHRKEIDLIAARDGVVTFVEVKGRRGEGFGHPLTSITYRKRSGIESVALWWISRNDARLRSRWRSRLEYRFDGVAILETGGTTRVLHVEDAWRPR